MKVSLRREDETSGLLRKTTEYVLYVKVELTEEEPDAIKKTGISDYLLMEYAYKGVELNWKVSDIVRKSDKVGEARFVGVDAVERSKMEQRVKE